MRGFGGWSRLGVAWALALGLAGLAAGDGEGARPSAGLGEGETNVHEVRPGESLWVIAANTIGDPTLWPALYRANRDQIKDPRLLYPGQRLAIPRIDPAERAKVRREAASLATR